MKKFISLTLVLFFILNLVSCKRNTVSNDFSNYKDDCTAVVQFVVGYDYSNIINDVVSTFTVDINEGYIKIDDSYKSTDNLTNSINRIREKGFTYIEVNKDYLIFWEDDGFYGWLWSQNPVEVLNNMAEGDRYIKSQKITDEWYEVRTQGAF